MAQRRKFHPGVIFLGIIAISIVALVGFWVWFSANQTAALRIAFTPTTNIADEEMPPAPDYNTDSAWAAKPGMASPVSMLPDGVMQIAQVPEVDVFYIHPTTYIPSAVEEKRWNGAIDQPSIVSLTDALALRHQASAFTLAGQVYAPRYRQASVGAFFDTSGQGVQAIFRAYADIPAAFDAYIQTYNQGRPFIIAGHSQGSLMALMLLRDRIAASPLKDQLVAAYLIGWPISIEADVEALGLTACDGPDATGCVISYQSFAQDGDPSTILGAFNLAPGVMGAPRTGTRMLCTNPLSWVIGGAASADANRGSVVRKQGDGAPASPLVGLTGARCGEDGILYLTSPPAGEWRANLLPGENYHAVDYNLFWSNIRENAAMRARAFIEAQGKVADTTPADVAS